MKIDTAFVCAGGKGTRLIPLTNNCPKPMLFVGEKPILHHIIDWMKSYGVKKFVFGLGYLPECVRNYFDDGSRFGVEIIHSEEKTLVSDGGALKLAEGYLPKRFLFAAGDILTKLDLSKLFEAHENNVKKGALDTVSLKEVSYEDAKRFGVAVMNGDKINYFVEKSPNPPSLLSNASSQVLEKDVLELIPKDKYCHFASEIMPELAANNQLYGYKFSDVWLDIGTVQALEEARKLWF